MICSFMFLKRLMKKEERKERWPKLEGRRREEEKKEREREWETNRQRMVAEK